MVVATDPVSVLYDPDYELTLTLDVDETAQYSPTSTSAENPPTDVKCYTKFQADVLHGTHDLGTMDPTATYTYTHTYTYDPTSIHHNVTLFCKNKVSDEMFTFPIIVAKALEQVAIVPSVVYIATGDSMDFEVSNDL